MSNIGILGGTFDPVHMGHIELAIKAYEEYALDKIWFMVSKKPPHKKNRVITDNIHRINMVKLAIEDYPFMEFSDFEMKREGYIYTADTLTLLTEQNPKDRYFFIVGGDSIRDLNTWYHPEIVLSKSTIIAATRDGINNSIYDNIVKDLLKQYSVVNPHIEKLEINPIEVSSSDIRAKFYSSSNEIKKYLNKKVIKYIEDNKLYLHEVYSWMNSLQKKIILSLDNN